MKNKFIFLTFQNQLQDALDNGDAIVAVLANLHNDAAHAVLIYSLDNEEFKVKDSHGRKYKISINRPDWVQVKIRLEI